jgi:hypothetical protein
MMYICFVGQFALFMCLLKAEFLVSSVEVSYSWCGFV